jgi:hypothetical protein
VKNRRSAPGDDASRGGGSPWFGVEVAARLVAIAAVEMERLLEIQSRSLGASVAAFWMRQAELTSTIASRPLGSGWAQLREENTAQGSQLITSWFHGIAQAQAALLDGLGQAVAEQYAAACRRPPLWADLGLDRRQSSVVIQFPDRRRTTG